MSFDLRTQPPPLSIREKWMIAVATLVVAITRVVFRARSPWDWDEILFALALDDFDVPNHHPHPPGFPLFIAAAKLLHLAGLPHFIALQTVTIVAGIVLVPSMFFFCRELRMTSEASWGGALLFAFLPNVWFFGETAFSDVPSVVLVIVACGLLLRGCRSGGAYVAGAILLAVAAGFRPQNLLIGLIPALLATWFQLRRRSYATIAAAIVIPAVILVGSYAAAAHASGGWTIYREAIAAHEKYIRSVDSFRSPTRPPLHNLLDDFFVRPFRAPLVNSVVAILALVSVVNALVRRYWPTLIAGLTFGPFAIAAWLLLDHMSASRFSIGYAPLFAIFAADGIRIVAAILPGERSRAIAVRTLTAGGVVTMIAWTIPALLTTSREISPPVSAVRWIRANVPAGSPVYADSGMGPYAEFFLRDYRVRWMSAGVPVARLESAPAWALAEAASAAPGATNFSWPRTRLWNVARHRYFDASVAPIGARIAFLEGWYDEESDGRTAWRWMGARSVSELPVLTTRGRLTIRIFVPVHVIEGVPVIGLWWNGREIDRFPVAEPYTERSYEMPPGGTSNRLVIETSRVANQARQGIGADARDLGLRIDRLEWLALKD